jgi:hypothetical protein
MNLRALLPLLLVGAGLSGCLTETPDLGAPATDPPLLEPVPHRLVVPELVDAGVAPLLPLFDLVGIGTRAAEPTLGVTPAGNVFVVALTEVMKSTDAGKTWTPVGPKVAGTNVPPTTLDPMIYVDAATGRIFVNQLTVACSFLSYSDDEGASWVHNPAACGLPGNDHQTIAAGPTELPSLWAGRAFYFCANQFADSTCSVSLDGGLTYPIKAPVFVPDHRSPCGGINGHVTTGPDGTAYLPAWRCDEPWIGISRDTGVSWEARRVSEKSSGAMDPSVAIASDGSAYYFWMDREGQPWLSVSTDAGRTWGPAIDVAFPGLVTSTLPTIVAGDAGRIAFAYVATTEGDIRDPGRVDGETRWNLYVTLSTDALEAAPTFTTLQLNPSDDPIHKGRCTGQYRCGAIVDFMDIVMAPDGRVYVASVDACGNETCLGRAPDDGATGHGEGVVGVLRRGPSLLADREDFADA